MKELELRSFKGVSKFKIEEVHWFDAQSSMISLTLKEIKEELKPLLTKSVGYLLEETTEYIVLGFTIFDNEFTKHHQLIPKGMIIRRRQVSR